MNIEDENIIMRLTHVGFRGLLDSLKGDVRVNKVQELHSQDRLAIAYMDKELIKDVFSSFETRLQSENKTMEAILGFVPLTRESMQVHALLLLRKDLTPKIGEEGDKMDYFQILLGTVSKHIEHMENNLVPGVNLLAWRMRKGASIEDEEHRSKALVDFFRGKPLMLLFSGPINRQLD